MIDQSVHITGSPGASAATSAMAAGRDVVSADAGSESSGGRTPIDWVLLVVGGLGLLAMLAGLGLLAGDRLSEGGYTLLLGIVGTGVGCLALGKR